MSAFKISFKVIIAFKIKNTFEETRVYFDNLLRCNKVKNNNVVF